MIISSAIVRIVSYILPVGRHWEVRGEFSGPYIRLGSGAVPIPDLLHVLLYAKAGNHLVSTTLLYAKAGNHLVSTALLYAKAGIVDDIAVRESWHYRVG